MDGKNVKKDIKQFTDVTIDGKVYNLGGYESEAYLHQVAAYVNSRLQELKSQVGYVRQDADTKSVLLYLNLADDYFHQKEQAEALQKKLEEQEREMYALKHDLVTLRIEQERLVQEKEQLEQQLQKSTGTYHRK